MGLYDLARRAALSVVTASIVVFVHSYAFVSALYIVSNLKEGEKVPADSRFAYIEPPLTDEDHVKTYHCRRSTASKDSYRLTLHLAEGPAKETLEHEAALLERALDVANVQRWAATFKGRDDTLCLVTQSLMFGLFMSEMMETPAILHRGQPDHADLTRNVARQLLEALAGLHKLNIIHGNVSAKHVYITSLKDEEGRREYEATLCNFSGSFEYHPGAKMNGDMSAGRAVAGTESAGWVAPEVVDAVLLGRDAGFAIDPPATDMWALGCLLLLLATRHEPFAAGSLDQLHKEHLNWAKARKVKSTHPILEDLYNLPPAYAHLVAKLLVSDPARRITAVDALQLPLFTASPSE